MTTIRMLLSVAALAALAALFGGGANAKGPVKPGMIPYLSHGIGVDESQFATPTSRGFTGDALKVDRAVAAANEAYDTYRLKTAIAARDARRVDRAVAAANEAYDTYRLKTAIAARQGLLTDQQPSVGLTGDSAPTRRPGTVTLPTASSASDGVDWSSFGLGAAMTALLTVGIAGVVLTTRRRGGVALP